MFEIKEVLRLWLRGEGYRGIDRLSGVDRKTVRRYVEAAVEAGLGLDGGEVQLTDVAIGLVCERVRPARPSGHGAGWESLVPHEAEIKAWLDKGLKLVKVQDLLARKGVVVAYRTLNRFATQRCGFGDRKTTVRVNDGEPGSELQVDFGRMGLVPDPTTGRRRMVDALIFTACYSRHCFVWLSHRQTTAAVIDGFEAAWAFFGGVFAVVIPDNLAAIVTEADDVEPRFNDAFLEYAQSRGFVIDPARVRSPKDKPRVERQVQYVRGSFFAGEDFADLADAQRRAATWCATTAGLRNHGTTQCRPAEVFRLEEAPLLGPAPAEAYDLPLYAKPKVHRDHHIEVDKALYSIPGNLIGFRVNARADALVVKVFHRGQLIKVHPRQRQGGRHTDACDLPTGTEVYAMRDIEALKRMAAGHGPSVGAYATRLDASHDAEMRKLMRVDLLISDDFALQSLDAIETADFYELVVERHRRASTVITSNREPAEMLAMMADPLLAQSAIDRLQSAAFELVVEGESYRRRQKPVVGASREPDDAEKPKRRGRS